KVQFLATIIHDPELIILDEPFSGLDPVNARLLHSLIDDMHRAGKTIIFSTHVLLQAEQLCDRIFMINKGQKILDGTMDEIREQFNPRTIVIEPLNGVGQDVLGDLPGIHSMTQPDARTIEAHLDTNADPQHVMGEVLRRLPTRRVEMRQATLEDVFVSLVEPGDSEDMLRAALSAGGSATSEEDLHA
ncbi:MAG: DUF4162 domain-containing protein, partial [Planctomycetota bacterium]